MRQLQLVRINNIAPYEVKAEGRQYVFDTAQGLRYEVRFFEEQPIGGCETWQFSFAKANSEPAPEDPYVRFTLFAIIVENRNPLLTDITADFDRTAVTLTNKPGD